MYYQRSRLVRYVTVLTRTQIAWIANAVTASVELERGLDYEQHIYVRVPYSITEALNEKFSSFGAWLDCAIER